MKLSRREMACIPLATVGACSAPPEAEQQAGWPLSWDKLLIERALKIEDLRYDKAERMVSRVIGPGYRYHTKLRDRRAHPTRESLEYTLTLMEAGGKDRIDRALATLDRVLELQDRNPASKWLWHLGLVYGRAAAQNGPADWNWADFNGATLLLIELRHGAKLPETLRARVREAIGHAARSIERRNVSMRYTNIAVKGTFVTLAAAEVLGDERIGAYARDRMVRLCQTIDETGTFDEYNSPTYARVTLTNLTRIRMFVEDGEARRRASAIEERCWLHLASHWDAARAQFAGPMSRCYSTDIGYPLWLEKSLGGKLGLARPDDVKEGGDAETAIHDFRCPEHLAGRFLASGEAHQHREMYQKGWEGETPVVGTCWVNQAYSLGSVNRGDFWNQRRPILAFFGGRTRPASSLTVRVIKDGYDFSSALLFSVQERGYLAGVVNFRDPGGDRHISLDMVKNGEFECGRLFLEFDFESLPGGFTFSEQERVVTLIAKTIQARLAIRGGKFGPNEPTMKLTAGKQSLVVTVDLLPAQGKKQAVWKNTTEAWLAFTLVLAGPGEQGFTQMGEEPPFSIRSGAGLVSMDWKTPVGSFGLRAATGPGKVEDQTRAFESTIGGKPVPAPRLSGKLLA